ncbi:MAG: hypothetical protein E4H26_05235 [Flavobacteriales bacterium]|nr:MAG: hypothetical protein E4H26_05235 [Flavobacteriales bacterium]
MKLNFTIAPVKFAIITVLPNSWQNEDYLKLLELMEYGDTTDLTDAEVKEICLLSLADSEPEAAAKIVLAYLFGSRLKSGQIENLSHEMIDEKMWEEYAELSLHELFFNATQLLYEAFNGTFPHPEAAGFKVKISPKEKMAQSVFDKNTEIALIRLLVQGMPQNTLINRLFEDQMQEGAFEDAKDIIWQYKMELEDDGSMVFEIISSLYWFHDFKYADTYTAALNIESQPS